MYDMVIKGGWVIPGDGPGYPADIAVQGTIIAAVAPNLSANLASSMVDAHGLWICPGFIDMHAHSALRSFTHPLLEPKIAQGFTTEVIHPDGLAPAPVKPTQREARHRYLRPLEGPGPDSWTWETLPQFLETLDATHPTTTLVPSVGHNAVREYVMGNTNREPTPRELQAMADEVEREIEAGARMLSFGLIYLPGVYAQTEELVALARVAARHAVPLMPHIRNEGEGILSALTEMIDVARLSGASLHLSHLKLVGSSNLLDALLTLLDKA
ncbi:MAG: D-aminoacylase, partial [Sulfobacillus thermosulfidooxidans]